MAASGIRIVRRNTHPSLRSRGLTRRGFTLIDLTLTMFIIGLFAAIAMPRYGELVTRFRLQAAADRVAADLQFARHQAKLQGSSQSVVFDTAANRYELTGLKDLDHPENPYAVGFSQDGSTTTLTSVSFGASGADALIVFDIYGRPDFGGSLVIEADGHQRTISVDGTTGAVEIQP